MNNVSTTNAHSPSDDARASQSSRATSEDAVKAAELVAGLDALPSREVFEAFEALDELPVEVVRAALSERTGPLRAPEAFDDDTRLAHGFPAPPLLLWCTRAVRPRRASDLNASARDQVRAAGLSYDGLDLPAEARLGGDPNAAEASFGETLEHRTVDDDDGMPRYDVLLYHGDSGAIFPAGESNLVGTIAYGKVEMKDRRERSALQAMLDRPVDEDVVVALADEAPAPPEREAPVESVVTRAPVKASARTVAASAAEVEPTAADEASTAEPEPAVAKPKKKVAAKKVAAKAGSTAKAAKKPAAKVASKPTAKKPAAKKTTAKKPAAKKPAAKKPAAKKPAAKKSAAKKTIAKKPAAKKTSAKK